MVTDATNGFVVVQVPSDVGDKVDVDPMHNIFGPVIFTFGLIRIVIGVSSVEVHFVVVSVKLKVAFPAANPVTRPLLETIAMEGLLLFQTPPVVGDSVVVPPTQILEDPVTESTGFASTLITPVLKDEQPVVLLVKINDAFPLATPVTTPAFVIVATEGLLLTQVPPVEGTMVEV